MTNETKHISPWLWVPSLYLVEGVPYFLVNSISVMMFAKMGVPNDQLTFFTTLLYFPWFLKGLWSPLVDVFRTKRWWVITMQALMTVLAIALALTLPHPTAEQMAEKSTSVNLFTLTLVLFIITAFASATHDIAADGYYMLAHETKSQAQFMGIRSTFYRIAAIFSQGGLVYIAGTIENQTGDIPLSWQCTIALIGITLLALTLYHILTMPYPAADQQRDIHSFSQIGKELADSFRTFFQKKEVGLAISFMLLYRMSEGFLIKLCQPFMIDSTTVTVRDGQVFGGGLGLSTQTVGWIYGTVGVICLLAGGILGGLYVSRYGLKRSLWVMAATLTLPSFVYVALSIYQPSHLGLISSAVGFEQFGYGFGYTAYMMYMMYFSEGTYKTSHFAICTAFTALSMMLPGFVAGYIEMAVGYTAFFWFANATGLATFIITYLVYKKLPE